MSNSITLPNDQEVLKNYCYKLKFDHIKNKWIGSVEGQLIEVEGDNASTVIIHTIFELYKTLIT